MRKVRHKCEEKLRDLTLPDPFTLDAFCDQLATDRGRPLHLMPIRASQSAACGLWISTDHADYVVHQVATSPLHREHIVLHELAHMIFDHAAVRGSANELAARFFPALDPRTVAAALGRTSYTSEQEQEAEMLAGLIGVHARRPTQRDADPTFARAMDLFGSVT
jgi:hypothetical protein